MTSLAYLNKCKADRMAYWDRAKIAKELRLSFRVYVPRADATSVRHIKPGSGIVGVYDDGWGPDKTLVYYEGDIYGTGKKTYKNLVYHAADRMAVDYPTVAKSLADTADLIHIGYFDYATEALVINDLDALLAWNGGPIE